MFDKIIFFILVLIISISCQSVKESTVNAQTTVESNANLSQTDDSNLPVKSDSETFAKTFVVNNKFDAAKGTFVYTQHSVELKENSLKGISIYIDGKKKDFLKIETTYPTIRADFSEKNGDHFFILVTASLPTGTCGDVSFVIVKVDEKLNVKISKPSENVCQGELYSTKIENINIDKPKEYYRQIAVGDLTFNLNKFDWVK